jgi:hypothetical protein
VRPVDIGETVVVRFPAEDERANAGYHIEGSYPAPDGSSAGWVMNTAHATGKAGDVFLCHPFMVHTGTWPHRGTGPRMIAQPAVSAPDGFVLDGSDPSPVARAIVKGLEMAD